ncbi:BTB/POZ domain-containing protein 6-B-like [Montipora foliosa]|uniref:BTB/POZ domain-containing protein 6-B-like n=1 Tax=Montipora foliosa TaxID=591990 RepID=UPI0035F1788A
MPSTISNPLPGVTEVFCMQQGGKTVVFLCLQLQARKEPRSMMASFPENWQENCLSVSQRTKFIFNQELLSDVKFVVAVSSAESESKCKRIAIPAHKFVLAISSPVFFAMFYGQIEETGDSIELPDCEYDSLLEFFRFLYTDEVNLTGNNVMHMMYLAKKYMVPLLAKKCNDFLKDNLDVSNVLSILPQAQNLADNDLEDRCWQLIESHTERVVMSHEFLTLEQSVVRSIAKREKLNVRELELFKAIDRWATAESERQGLAPGDEGKRKIIGEEVLKAIRFPLISQKDFAAVVVDCNILINKELGDMLKYYSDVPLASPSPFIHTPRSAVLLHCERFASVLPPSDKGWNYLKTPDGIGLMVNKDILLHGVRHFGSDGHKYTVSIEIRDGSETSLLVKHTGTYMSQEDHCVRAYYWFDVMFKSPVILHKDKMYEIVSHISGPRSWYGNLGKSYVQCLQVKFQFVQISASVNTTDVTEGQFPSFLFAEV